MRGDVGKTELAQQRESSQLGGWSPGATSLQGEGDVVESGALRDAVWVLKHPSNAVYAFKGDGARQWRVPPGQQAEKGALA
ncbi:hypothetical protein GCM10009692_00770 [Leucobacter aridicollis]